MLSQGLEMGLQAQPLFPVCWEERMEQNLAELRADLGIDPVLEGPYSWTSDPLLTAALPA